jgi:hypothetical protein
MITFGLLCTAQMSYSCIDPVIYLCVSLLFCLLVVVPVILCCEILRVCVSGIVTCMVYAVHILTYVSLYVRTQVYSAKIGGWYEPHIHSVFQVN